jgi:hypothetical protein
MHAHVSDKSHDTQLFEMFEYLGRYCIALVYGMVESQIPLQFLWLVLERVPSDCEGVPSPSCANIHFLDALMYNIMYTKPAVVLFLVWLILEYFLLAPIFSPRVVTNFHLLEAWSSSDSLDNLPWIRSSLTVARHLLRWLSIVALKELLLEVVILGCTIPSGDIHELDALTSQ